MGRSTVTLLPILQRRLAAFGDNLRLARRRRKLTATQVAERAGITRPTLYAVERGDSAVSFGVYANVLFCLGLDKDLDSLGRDDELGRKIQDANLAKVQGGQRIVQRKRDRVSDETIDRS